MCIAIVKPLGTRIPSKSILRKCWDNNPDGAGLMYNDGNNVVIHKGFTKFKGFYKFLKALDRNVDLTDKDLVLHFRIATSGGVSRECTHPFPVTKDLDEMRKLDNICRYGFAHNGIIDGYGSKDFSDTMEYVKDVVSSINNIENNEALLDALAREHASKFALLTKDNFEIGGTWIYDEDCYFSNTSYKENYYYSSKLTDAQWAEFYSKYDYCDCCDECTPIEDLIDTGYGKVCEHCFDNLFEKETEEEKEEERVF